MVLQSHLIATSTDASIKKVKTPVMDFNKSMYIFTDGCNHSVIQLMMLINFGCCYNSVSSIFTSVTTSRDACADRLLCFDLHGGWKWLGWQSWQVDSSSSYDWGSSTKVCSFCGRCPFTWNQPVFGFAEVNRVRWQTRLKFPTRGWSWKSVGVDMRHQDRPFIGCLGHTIYL